MSKFKPGDRIRAISKPELIGTVQHINDDGLAFLVLDEFLKIDGYAPQKEGYITEDVETKFELVERTDWESLWDAAAGGSDET